MSAYRTIRVSRSRAIAELLKHIASQATEEELGNMMDELLKERLYNCQVVQDGVENDDEELRYVL